MRIFVLTATYELRVSRKSHLRDHPIHNYVIITSTETVLLSGGYKEMSSEYWLTNSALVYETMQMRGGGRRVAGVSANEYSCITGDLTQYLTYDCYELPKYM